MSLSNSKLPCLILGAGGHSRVLIEALRTTGHEIVGVLAVDLKPGSELMGLPVLGGDDVVDQYDPEQIRLINGVGSIPGNTQRWHLAELMRNKQFQFGVVVHENITVAGDLCLAEGVQLMAGVTIQPGCKIGLDTIVNTGSLIDHDCEIGDHCHIAPGVTLSGNVQIGSNVHIGIGAHVIQGIRIGSHAVIAAGTTVYKDIPEGMLVKQKAELVMESVKG